MTSLSPAEAFHGPELDRNIALLVEQMAVAYAWDPAPPGPLVADYLSRTEIPDSAKTEVRAVAHQAANWYGHFLDSDPRVVGDLSDKQETARILWRGASWLETHIGADSEASQPAYMGPGELPLERSWSGALITALRKHCNTSAPSTIPDLEALAGLYGVSSTVIRDALQTQAIFRHDPYYTRKIGEPERITELDPVLNQRQGKVALMFFGSELGRNEDMREISAAIEAAPGAVLGLSGLDALRRTAFGSLSQLLANPLAVARAIEILPGTDPRFLLLQLLIEHNDPASIVAMLGQ